MYIGNTHPANPFHLRRPNNYSMSKQDPHAEALLNMRQDFVYIKLPRGNRHKLLDRQKNFKEYIFYQTKSMQIQI